MASNGDQDERRAAIEAVAFELLRERGYDSTSMLAIARAANASNETLSRWYGNKQGLFSALVARNAGAVRAQLDVERTGQDPVRTLRRIGPQLLAMVTSERAVLLNRVAATEAGRSSELGAALSAAGRETVLPLVAGLLAAAGRRGALRIGSGGEAATEAAAVYLDLLIGDLQVRRVTGALEPLSDTAIRRRAARAWRLFVRLHPVPGADRSN